MPLYLYESVGDVTSPPESFEIMQSMHDPALTHHPVTGQPIRRLIQAPHLGLKHSPATVKQRLASQNLARHGFVKYERDRLTGSYHRTAGSQGPASFRP